MSTILINKSTEFFGQTVYSRYIVLTRKKGSIFHRVHCIIEVDEENIGKG
jgi:hypothetical protein